VSSGAASVLVVGGSGLVGTQLLERFADDAMGTRNATAAPGLIALDITDARACRELLAELRPTTVIHCAALTHVDLCEREPERSHAVNVVGTRNVAEAAARVGARYLFFSTDYVFGGDAGPHRLDEPFNPLNAYGAHKLEAEQLVAGICEDHVIVRACNLYGYQPGGKNFVMAVWNCGHNGVPMRVPRDQWGCPTLAADLSESTRLLAGSSIRGAVHLAGPDYLDRESLARRAADAFRIDASFIVGVDTVELGQEAARPRHGGLDASATEASLGFRFRDLTAGLRDMSAAFARETRRNG